VDLVKALRLRAAILGRLPFIKRTAKICFGLTAAVFLLQFYCVRELLFMEVVVALGFLVVADRRRMGARLHSGFMVA